MQQSDRLVVSFCLLCFCFTCIFIYFSIKRIKCVFPYVSISLTFTGMRTSRAWEVHIPSSASSISPPPSVLLLLLLLPPFPKGLASAHACETAWEWLFV